MDFQLGALKERSDIRDYQIVAAGAFSFPQTFIIDYLPKVKNQGSVNSCVAHATSTILEYFNKKEINSDD
jgi:C1A family cysteine protease